METDRRNSIHYFSSCYQFAHNISYSVPSISRNMFSEDRTLYRAVLYRPSSIRTCATLGIIDKQQLLLDSKQFSVLHPAAQIKTCSYLNCSLHLPVVKIATSARQIVTYLNLTCKNIRRFLSCLSVESF